MSKNYLCYNPITNLPNQVQSNSCPEALGIPQVVLKPIKRSVKFTTPLFSANIVRRRCLMCLFWMRPQRKRCTVKGGKAWRNLEANCQKKSTLIDQRSVSKRCKRKKSASLYIEVSLSKEWKTRLFFHTMIAVIKGPMASI